VLGIDDRGKVRLSMRLVDQATGEEIADTRPPREDGPDRGPRSDRGPRRDGGGGGDRGGNRGGSGDRGPRRDGGSGDRGPRPERAAEPEGEPTFAPSFITGDRD
jgi:polyribonucleotide nucleotidyltransferase